MTGGVAGSISIASSTTAASGTEVSTGFLSPSATVSTDTGFGVVIGFDVARLDRLRLASVPDAGRDTSGWKSQADSLQSSGLKLASGGADACCARALS